MSPSRDPIPMQDVIPPRDRSIRNIPVPPGRRPSARGPIPPEPPPPHYLDEKPDRRTPRFMMWAGATISFAALLFFGFSLAFAGTTVTVDPKSAVATIDGSFTASPDAPLKGLTYQLITIERQGSEVIKASGEADVARRAEGAITVSNSYSSSPQRLIKNTRFEAPDGKIYRINESIEVPGQRVVGGKTVPGEIEVTVYADSPGETYNRGLTDFTIPGFRGDPRYTKFSARSKTPMAGGFVGRERVVSEEEQTAARARIRERLGIELKEAARAQMPGGFVLFDDAAIVSFSSGDNAPRGTGEIEVVEKGTLHGVLFNNRELAAFIARNSVDGYSEEPVFLPSVLGLAFAISGKANLVFPLERPLSFTLKGQARIVWHIDDAELKNALLGRQKAALPTIVAEYPVAAFRVTSRPFWAKTLPDRPGRLNIVITIPQ